MRRSKYLFDALNIPAVINEMAVQTLLANMDRCTKNFYIYQHPQTLEWFRYNATLDRLMCSLQLMRVGCTDDAARGLLQSARMGMHMAISTTWHISEVPELVVPLPCRIPWDIETSMGQDNGLGGQPGPYYCVLACEQWWVTA